MRKVPSLRRHKPTSQAVVTLNGKDYYLGIWPSGRRTPPTDVQVKYERLIAEYLASGRQHSPDPNQSIITPPILESLSLAELLAKYWDFAAVYYRKPDGSATSELDCLRAAFRPLRRLYDDLPAAEFSPTKLKAVREKMVQSGLTRTTINRHIGRIKRLFKWAVENELISPSVCHGLTGGERAQGRAERSERTSQSATSRSRHCREDHRPLVVNGRRNGQGSDVDGHAIGRTMPASSLRHGPVE